MITGGLGNQLFQICAALALTGEKSLSIDSSLSSVKDKNRRRASEKIKLPSNVNFIEARGPLFISKKVFNFFIRLSVSKNPVIRNTLILDSLLFFGSKYFSWRYKQKLTIVLPDGVQNTKTLSLNSDKLFIGYFQNNRYLNQLRSADLFMLNVNEVSLEVLELKKLASKRTILVVHVRLGDYQKEEKFGIPQISYYEEGFKLAHRQFSFDETWVFTNDLAGAKKLVPIEFQNRARFFESVGLDEVHLLQVMSFGSHFILGNSTFGWWSAQFSENQNKLVVVPNPWFKGIPEPEGLIPEDWIRLDAGF